MAIERREHPRFSRKQAERIARDHLCAKGDRAYPAGRFSEFAGRSKKHRREWQVINWWTEAPITAHGREWFNLYEAKAMARDLRSRGYKVSVKHTLPKFAGFVAGRKDVPRDLDD